jgi:hypothetical protein
MPDPRLEALAGVVVRVEGAACWLARQATRAAVAGAVAALVLWWVIAGDRIDEWWQGTAGSVVVGLLLLAPAAWLFNVRNALIDLVALPETLGGVTSRRAAHLRRRGPVRRPDGGLLGAVRAVRGVVRDYGDVTGSWATVAQLVVPSFWLLTVAAFAAVPVLAVVAGVATLVVSL